MLAYKHTATHSLPRTPHMPTGVILDTENCEDLVGCAGELARRFRLRALEIQMESRDFPGALLAVCEKLATSSAPGLAPLEMRVRFGYMDSIEDLEGKGEVVKQQWQELCAMVLKSRVTREVVIELKEFELF